MAVAKYNEVYNLFLEALQDGNNHLLRDIVNTITVQLNLSNDDVQEMVPSQTGSRFYK